MRPADKILDSTMSFSLRPSDKADNGACGVVVGRAAAASAYAARVPFALDYITDVTPLALPQGYARLVAERDGQIRGFVQFDQAAGYVKYLFTDPDAQDQGVGSALLDAAERTIDGAVRLTVLWVNDRGLLWYMRRGYRIIGGELEADWHGGPVVWIELEKAKLS